MSYLSSTGISPIEEHEATGDVAELYDLAKREAGVPAVPNILKAIAPSSAVLKNYMNTFRDWGEMTIPQTLISMICFTIAERANCQYCAAVNEFQCRTLGVDEATLAALAKELGDVNPERVRAIIDFALQVAKDPQKLVLEDYDALRDHGITDDEIVQIVYVAASIVFMDIVADALKIAVEPGVAQGLAQIKDG